MSESTSTLRERTIAAARAIGDRARGDPAYLRRLAEDPAGTFVAAGVPPEMVGALLREEGLAEEEVQGYLGTLPAPGGLPAGAGGLGGRGGVMACLVTACLFTDCIATADNRPVGGFGAGPTPGGLSR